MSSAFAQRFNEQARPLLWREHSETVRYHDDDGTSRDLTVIWLRTDPRAEEHEGIGAEGFFATATAVASVDELPDPHGAAEIERKGERWAIRLIELQDEWTWVLHLAHPDAELDMPDRIR